MVRKLLYQSRGDAELRRTGQNPKALCKVIYLLNVYDAERPDDIDGQIRPIEDFDLSEILYQDVTMDAGNGQFCDCRIISPTGEFVGTGKGIYLSDVTQQAIFGMEEATNWHVVGIVSSADGRMVKGFGTGTAIRWRSKAYLLTAAPVLDDTSPDELSFFFRPEGTLRRGDLRSSHRWEMFASPISPSVGVKVTRILVDRAMDLAAIEVEPTLGHKVNVTFYAIPEEASLPADAAGVLIIGYPSDLARIDPGAGSFLCFASQWTTLKTVAEMDSDARYLEDFDLVAHTLAEFTHGRLGFIKAHGFSGAGVWYRNPSGADNLWTPNLQFAGVVTHYYPNKQLLKIVRVERVLDFLNSQEGESVGAV